MLFRPQAIRVRGANMAKQLELFDRRQSRPIKPLPPDSILHSLTNVNVEIWWKEGLFRQSKVMDAHGNIVSISAGKKKRWAERIIAKYFEGGYRSPDNRSGSPSSIKLWEPELWAQNHKLVNGWFSHCKNAAVRERTEKFILQEYPPVGARYITRGAGVSTGSNS